MSHNIHENDIGTKFKAVIIDDEGRAPINISDATVKKILFQPPKVAAFERDAVFSTTGNDGFIEYISIAGDLTPCGDWSIQARVIGPGYENSSEVEEFKVLPNLT